jgi:sugar fermentation stimulation protein A
LKFPDLIPAIFIQRDNRFTAGVQLATGETAAAFVPTTGRLTGVLRSGCRVWLTPALNPHRKTPYTLLLAELDHGGLCSVNAITANRLFYEAVKEKNLSAFAYEGVEKEVPLGHSRLDFRLSEGGTFCWVEVKSVTYVEKGLGMFPDAPTERGRKHLEVLLNRVAKGDRASAVFITQRGDAQRFTPYQAVDPAFYEAVCRVHQAGVEVHAYRCEVRLAGIEIAEEIPVLL